MTNRSSIDQLSNVWTQPASPVKNSNATDASTTIGTGTA
jgi:hypothetical protein